jgi:hypothetical protein
MSKQLLIYKSAVPISVANHKAYAVEQVGGYSFTAGINAVPLAAVEFLAAAAEYVIVFTINGEEVTPAAVLGIKNDENLYLSDDGNWKAKYVPAFLRRYPFVFASSPDSKTLTLCVDESYAGVNQEGRGHKFFNDDGTATPYVDNVLKFLKDYQAQYERTRVFCKRIKELGLLEPMQAQVTTPAGGKTTLSGFYAVSRAKLRALPTDALSTMAKNDELELLYLHLSSMRNFEELKDRFITSGGADKKPEPAGV